MIRAALSFAARAFQSSTVANTPGPGWIDFKVGATSLPAGQTYDIAISFGGSRNHNFFYNNPVATASTTS